MKYTAHAGNVVFPFPQGANPTDGLDKVYEYWIKNDIPPTFCFITENDLEKMGFKKVCKEKIVFQI